MHILSAVFSAPSTGIRGKRLFQNDDVCKTVKRPRFKVSVWKTFPLQRMNVNTRFAHTTFCTEDFSETSNWSLLFKKTQFILNFVEV